jgi:hypothetical protein
MRCALRCLWIAAPKASGTVFEMLHSRQQIDQGSPQAIDRPGHHDVKSALAGVFEHLVEAGPLLALLGPAEEDVLFKAICDDLESSGFSLSLSASDDVRDQQLNEMTDRELLGVILGSPIDMSVSGSAIHKRPAPPTNVRFRG